MSTLVKDKHAQPAQGDASHINDDVLRRFDACLVTEGRLEEKIAGHLADCEQCAQRYESLRMHDDPIVALLRQPDPLQPFIERGQLRPNMSVDSTKSYSLDRCEDTDRQNSSITPPLQAEMPNFIGHYSKIRRIAKGGFGEVWLYHDPETQRKVAVKALRPDRLSTRADRDAVMRDAQVALELKHPHIVRVHECRELADGRCVVIMDYIEGRTLEEAIKARRFTEYRAAKLIAKIADALDYAHGRKILHRDIKPANILLDESEKPYLADFGLALREDEQHLHAGERAGSAPYLSPEQVLGHAHHLDARSDIWSLGVVIYEMVTQDRPFDGQTKQQLFAEIRERPHKPLRNRNSKVSAALEAVCDRCLKKEVGERYPNAAAMAQDLQRIYRKPWYRAALWASVVIVPLLLVGIAIASSAKPESHDGSTESQNEGTAGQPLGAVAVPGGWRPILNHTPEEVAWMHIGENRYILDRDSEQLEMRHAAEHALLSFGELSTSAFSLRFVLSIDTAQGAAGCFWALHPNRDAFPREEYRCMALVLRRNSSERVGIELDEMRLVPSPLDATMLFCRGTRQIAKAASETLPAKDIAVEMTVSEGKLRDLKLNGTDIDLPSNSHDIAWAAAGPARYGFLIINGRVTVENASLRDQETMR